MNFSRRHNLRGFQFIISVGNFFSFTHEKSAYQIEPKFFSANKHVMYMYDYLYTNFPFLNGEGLLWPEKIFNQKDPQ